MSEDALETYEHPEDRANRERSESEAATFGDHIANERIADLRRLLTLYSDADAESMLGNLREWFWAMALPDAVRRAKL